MTQTEILEEVKKLSPIERLEMVDNTIHLLRKDIEQIKQPLHSMERKQRLEEAASALIKDYAENKELIGFTALDGEGFYV